MTPGAACRVSTPDAKQAVLATFHHPHWTAPARDEPGLLRHRRHDCELRVRASDGVVCYVAFHTKSEPASPRPARIRAAPARRRRRGGAGTIWPTTWRELRTRLRAAGCGLARRGKHWHVALPGGQTYTLPCTASDHRALRNAAHELAGLGVDLRRRDEHRQRRETA
ncbi:MULTISPECIES: hypothetical protein [unclassified Amycolatopsis]|uniref:hypothetical protein n=1 Tax=unclassified Amycolatopsis TaxID=2618356 RepID=UPI00106E8F10|nr:MULTISPECIES: hypothetical protein [unclassified Amycolatopsis]